MKKLVSIIYREYPEVCVNLLKKELTKQEIRFTINRKEMCMVPHKTK